MTRAAMLAFVSLLLWGTLWDVACLARLATAGLETSADREIVALIAYLQRLGTDAKARPATQAALMSTHGGGR